MYFDMKNTLKSNPTTLLNKLMMDILQYVLGC